MHKKSLITGVGIYTPDGAGVDAFLGVLKAGKAKVLFEDYQPERRQTLATETAIACVEEAFRSAQLNVTEFNPARVGLVVGGQNINQNYIYQQCKMFEISQDNLLPSYAVQFMDTDLIGILSEKFNIKGEGFTIGGASASGNMAIIQAARLIQLELVDICVVVGALADFSPLELQAFLKYGALSPTNFCNPFDETHNGFVYGQASGCIILESAESAKARSVPAMAQLVGSGVALDAHRFGDPNVLGEAFAMRKALEDAGINTNQIDYLNPHGTGSVLGDETEVSAIINVFDSHVEKLWVNTTKSITGHCLWSAGMVEAIATILQMQHGFLHANPNLKNPIVGGINFVGQSAIDAKINYALSNSFGFGGINTSIVIKK